MKVIKKGRPQKGWATEAKCSGAGNGNGGCGALLLVEEGDLYLTESSARDETTTYITFRCPECGVQTDINSVPSHVKSNLSREPRPESGPFSPGTK